MQEKRAEKEKKLRTKKEKENNNTIERNGQYGEVKKKM
jgi:hypothetical protein